MSVEIERKFLVKSDHWRSLAKGTVYRQGYILTTNKTATVRVRIVGDHAYLTLKGKTAGLARSEFEYPIPIEDAKIILETLCDRPLIEKTRYRIPLNNVVWEVDEFSGENQGLILAEVELIHENQSLELPDWIGEEVSGDLKYYNVNLCQNPYQLWTTKN
ncbi:adenylate cyclase [Rippkaea orientalis PCC 8801]|uniref:Adenylate cyclase n=1 Tax=Rippkaea orientalis (strain PCC 8801 / RF-1) TaxID=41431 RepID=B7K413_RIPO1|nr:CYTH domain-containing protein [Rippkaea orientalis]ACK66553.1 adenylate cyclase [Rippkaea orientalis PCC 8801]